MPLTSLTTLAALARRTDLELGWLTRLLNQQLVGLPLGSLRAIVLTEQRDRVLRERYRRAKCHIRTGVALAL
jgi:hypothetical protein